MSEKKDINEVIKNYKTNKDELIKEYEKIIKACEEEKGLYIRSLRTHYDVREIDVDGNPLSGHICDTVGGVNKDKAETFKKYSSVVFDSNSNNFHIFPLNKEIYNRLSKEFAKLRDDIREHIKGDKKLLELATLENAGAGPFTLFRNVERVMNVGEEQQLSANNIYQYVAMKKGGVFYSINFMRYICDKNGKVGCTMCAIQFHKDYGQINVGQNNQFEICYPLNDDDCSKNNKGGANTTKRTIGRGRGKKEATNVCYNPPVCYPDSKDNDYEEQIEDIVGYFKEFVEHQEEICNKLEEYQWKYDPVSKKNINLKNQMLKNSKEQHY